MVNVEIMLRQKFESEAAKFRYEYPEVNGDENEDSIESRLVAIVSELQDIIQKQSETAQSA